MGAGVTGDAVPALVSNEEALSTSEMKVAPVLFRHAVRVNRRANKKAIVDLREEARMRLSEWGLTKVDNKRFAQFSSITNSDIPEGTATISRTPTPWVAASTPALLPVTSVLLLLRLARS